MSRLTSSEITELNELMHQKDKHDLRNTLGQSILGEIQGFIRELKELIVDYILAPLPPPPPHVIRNGIAFTWQMEWTAFYGRGIPTAHSAPKQEKKRRHNKKLLYNH
jgi:hypothetical protein